MAEVDDGTPKYPMLRFLVRHGQPASIGLALLVLAMGVWLAIIANSISFGVFAVVLAGVAYVLARVVVELVGLITDMLLPQ